MVVGYGLSKFSGNMPRKYEIVRLMNRSSLTEVCKRAADLGFGSSNYIKNVKDYAKKLYIEKIKSEKKIDDLRKQIDNEKNKINKSLINHLNDYRLK